MSFNYKTMFKICGFVLAITGIGMLLTFFYALFDGEQSCFLSFGITSFCSICIGLLLYKLVPTSVRHLRTRDGYLIVIMCWIVASLFGALPYWLSGQVPSFINAFFESVSGYTTTGATVITSVHLSNSLMLWKALTHWMGGMGILVFIISILPALGVGGQRIASAETPGPALAKMAPRMQDLAKSLYVIYISLTLIEFLLLFLGSDMNAFESLINSMGSVSTAGLFLHPQGIGYYNSIYIELVISIFTILASINFITYICILKRNFSDIHKNVEIKIYLIIIGIATVFITLILRLSGTFDSIGEAARHAFFQVTAFASTSGFSIDDYTLWPTCTQIILFTLLFVGGCAASTSGSIKISRIIIMFKLIARGFYKRIHPRAVQPIKIGANVISSQMVSSITTFIVLYCSTFMLSALVLSLQGLDLTTTLSASASLLSTTGIGFGDISNTGNFALFAPPLRLFMSLIMIVGRLELFTVIFIFFPSFWNPDRAVVK